jgi:hypothetical protein
VANTPVRSWIDLMWLDFMTLTLETQRSQHLCRACKGGETVYLAASVGHDVLLVARTSRQLVNDPQVVPWCDARLHSACHRSFRDTRGGTLSVA